MKKEIIERVNKIPLNKLMEDVWPVSLCLMRDCYWIAFWETEDIENAYTQEGSEDFEGFVKRVIASELENEKPDDDGFMYLNVDFAIAEAECNKALNPTSGSKRGPEKYENLRQLILGRNINAYQKTLAINEFENLINRYHGKGN